MLLSSRCVTKPKLPINYRSFGWLTKIFNARDEMRLKQFGPDRTCAEWILRNGGQVKFVNEAEYLADYNKLPPEGHLFHIQEIDATNSSIAHYGFVHLDNCKYIEKFILHKCNAILDKTFERFVHLDGSLTFLQISSCHNVSEEGLNSLPVLSKLETLLIFDLPYIKNKESVVKNLQTKLAKCNITFK